MSDRLNELVKIIFDDLDPIEVDAALAITDDEELSLYHFFCEEAVSGAEPGDYVLSRNDDGTLIASLRDAAGFGWDFDVTNGVEL